MLILRFILRPSIVIGVVGGGILLFLWFRLRRDQFYLLIGTAIVCFAVGEGVCRAIGLGDPRRPVWREDVVHEEDVPYRYEPDGRLIYIYPDDPRGYFGRGNKVVGHINSLGFRGPDAEYEKKSGVVRLAVLGDSFTLGIGVRDEDTLPAQLEQALAGRHVRAEVLNFGASATNTPDQVRLLREYVMRFDPDVVVLVVFLNDADVAATVTILNQARALARVRMRSYFLNAIFDALERHLQHRKLVARYLAGYSEDSAGWKSMRASLREAQALADAQGFKLVVALYPVLFRLNGDYPFTVVHEDILGFCREQGIASVDLLDGLAGIPDKEAWVHPKDQHPNEETHAKAAEYLADFLIESGAVPAPNSD